MFRFFLLVMTIGAIAAPGKAQSFQRKATMLRGGSPGSGQCTVEVVVDGAADVEIRGDTATLRNLSGQTPQWRRFECTAPIPVNASNFRFTGVDGRGRQELVRDPSHGGAAVVRIQDQDGGSEGYTFDLNWGNDGDWRGPLGAQRDHEFQRDPRRGSRLAAEQAVRVCQQAVRQQAGERFHSSNVAFRATKLDDNPGRQDWVNGIADVRRGYERDEAYRFSCSVNFDNGVVRSVNMEPMEGRAGWYGDRDGGNGSNLRAMDSCQQAVEQRIRRDGFQHIDFLSLRMDDRPGRNDSIVGIARADRQYRSDTFNFSCGVNLQTGVVRSVKLDRR